MFTNEERKAFMQHFWSKFDEYGDTVPDIAWRKKKWILHDTKISHIDLKFDICSDSAIVAMEINHKSENRRLGVYELVERYRAMLEQGFKEKLTWDFCYMNTNNQEVCRIYVEKHGVDINKYSDWQTIYTFLAENMLQLQDNFLEIQDALKEDVNLLNRDE